MSRDWETQLRSWAKAPGKTEQDKMERAEREVRLAIAESPALAQRNIEVFAQGSYKNHTNIPTESDVDVCVVLKDVFFSDWFHVDGRGSKSPEVTKRLKAEVGISDASYTYEQFKDEVGAALVAHFGESAVKRGDKAFDVHESSRWVDSDVVAALEHRMYLRGAQGQLTYTSGVEFVTDSGKHIVNYPKQHYEKGVTKNLATGERYKAMVRALKCLRNAMDDAGKPAADPIRSFLSECLVSNVENAKLNTSSYVQDMKNVISAGWNAARSEAEWYEVNRIKYLFHANQPWTRKQVEDFFHAAWNFDGLKDA